MIVLARLAGKTTFICTLLITLLSAPVRSIGEEQQEMETEAKTTTIDHDEFEGKKTCFDWPRLYVPYI